MSYAFTRNPVIAVRSSYGNYWLPYDNTIVEIERADDPEATAIDIAKDDTAGFRGGWQNEDWPY